MTEHQTAECKQIWKELMQKIDSVLTGLCDKRHMYSGVEVSQ